jgi:hypothetical protein
MLTTLNVVKIVPEFNRYKEIYYDNSPYALISMSAFDAMSSRIKIQYTHLHIQLCQNLNVTRLIRVYCT